MVPVTQRRSSERPISLWSLAAEKPAIDKTADAEDCRVFLPLSRWSNDLDAAEDDVEGDADNEGELACDEVASSEMAPLGADALAISHSSLAEHLGRLGMVHVHRVLRQISAHAEQLREALSAWPRTSHICASRGAFDKSDARA